MYTKRPKYTHAPLNSGEIKDSFDQSKVLNIQDFIALTFVFSTEQLSRYLFVSPANVVAPHLITAQILKSIKYLENKS